MFSEERAKWKKLFDAFKKHFGEEVGFIPSVYESNDVDIDFFVGEDSGNLFGIQVFQFLPDEELNDGETGQGEDKEEDEDENKEEDENDDEEQCEDDDESGEIAIEYLFVKTDKKVKNIKDKKQLDLKFALESEEEKQKIHLTFYGNDEEFTVIVAQIEKEQPEVFMEHPDFDF